MSQLWESELWISPVFEWSKSVWSSNGWLFRPLFEYQTAFRTPFELRAICLLFRCLEINRTGHLHNGSSIHTHAFYYLAPLPNDCLVTSRCMQFTFGDKREVYLLGESALPVNEKESMQEGKKSIGPRMKYGHADLNSFCSQTNGRCSFFPLAYFLFRSQASHSSPTGNR